MTDKLPVEELVRVKSLLRLLWVTYDACGMSMSRSYESVLLESALKLLEDVDNENISVHGGGDLVNETRNYLSNRMLKELDLEIKPVE